MRVIDPGHIYALPHLDGPGEEILTYVKREGPGYPGNIGHHPGTNLQEVMRSEIHRIQYLNNQIKHPGNDEIIWNVRRNIAILENRAAGRHERPRVNFLTEIELMPVCPECGHIGCSAGYNLK